MDAPPKKTGEKLSRVWTHTAGAFAFLAAVVTIIGFFGFRPPTVASNEPKPASPKKQPEVQNKPPEEVLSPKPSLDGKPMRPRASGTFHIDGGFDPGQSMLTKEPIATQGDQLITVILKNAANGKDETITDVRVVVAVEANQPVALWRKGTRFVRGIRLTSGSPHVRFGGTGIQPLDVPTDESGKLAQNVIWPLDKMFLDVEYPGPVEISGLPPLEDLLFGDSQTLKSGKTLPTHFSLDVPKPGEIMGAINGEFTYPGESDQKRSLVIEADSSPNHPAIKWTSDLNSAGSTLVRSNKTDRVDQGLSRLKILYSKSSD